MPNMSPALVIGATVRAARIVKPSACQQIKQDMSQEAVSLDIDGALYII